MVQSVTITSEASGREVSTATSTYGGGPMGGRLAWDQDIMRVRILPSVPGRTGASGPEAERSTGKESIGPWRNSSAAAS